MRTCRIVLAGLLALGWILAGSNLIVSAETGRESFQGLLVSLAGLVFAVIFAGLWADEINRKVERSSWDWRQRRPF